MACGLWVALFSLRTETVQGWLTMALERLLAEATGERAEIEAITLDPWARILRIEGLGVYSAERGEPLLFVRALEARLGWADGRPVASYLHIEEPSLFLHFDKAGLMDFKNARRSKTDRPKKTPWKRLRVTGATLLLEHPQGRVFVDGLDLLPVPIHGDYRLTVEDLLLKVGEVEQEAHKLRWDGIQVGLDRILVPNLALNMPLASVHGTFDFRPGGPVLAGFNLFSELQGFNEVLPSDRQLEGTLSLYLRVEGESRSPEISGVANLDLLEYLDTRPGRKPKHYSSEDLEVHWHLEPGQVVLDRFSGSFGRGSIEGSARLLPAEKKLKLQFETRNTSLEEALRETAAAPAAWVDLRMELSGDLEGTWSPLFIAGEIKADIRDFVVKSGPLRKPTSSVVLSIPRGGLQGILVIDPKDYTLHLDMIRTPHSVGRAEVRMAHPKAVLDVDLRMRDMNFADLAPLGGIGLQGRGTFQARVLGPPKTMTASGHASADNFRVLGVPFGDHVEIPLRSPFIRRLEMNGFTSRVGETDYTGGVVVNFTKPLTLEINAAVQNGRISDLSGMFVHLPGIEGRASGGLELAGPPRRMTGSANFKLHDVELVSETFPEGRAESTLVDGIFALKDLSVWRTRGLGVEEHQESLRIRGGVGRRYVSNFDLVGDGFHLQDLDAIAKAMGPDGKLARSPKSLVQGDVHIDGRLSGTLMDLQPFARVSMRGVRYFDESVEDSVLWVDTRNNHMQVVGGLVGNAAGVRGEMDLDTLAYRVDLDLDDFPLHVLRPYAAAGHPVRAVTDGRLVVTGKALDPPDIEAELERAKVTWGEQSLESRGTWTFIRRGPHLLMSGLAIEGKGTRLVVEKAERTSEGFLELRGGGSLDLSWLALLGPQVLRSGGTAEIQAVVFGPERSPAIDLSVELKNALIKTIWFPNAFENLKGQIRATPDKYDFRIEGAVGGGKLDSFNGVILADRWTPRSYDLKAKVLGARVRYIESLPPMVADADLAFTGPVGALLLSGSIDVREMVFSERIDWESWILELGQQRLTAAAPAERGNYFSMDMEVKAPETGRIRNNVANGTISADLRVLGDTSRPGVVGEVLLQQGSRVFLKEREFEVNRGEIRFVDPYAFDPELDFEARTEIRGRMQDYQVYMRVAGPFSKWQTTASSEPALSQADINWLLLFGATREELEDYGGLSGALAWEGVDILGHELGISTTMVDRWNSGLLQLDRWDIVTGASARGTPTVSSEPRLIVEKDIGPPWDLTVLGELNMVQFGDTYASVEKRIAKRLYMTGYWASTEQGRSLSIGGAFGTDFSLRWELD